MRRAAFIAVGALAWCSGALFGAGRISLGDRLALDPVRNARDRILVQLLEQVDSLERRVAALEAANSGKGGRVR